MTDRKSLTVSLLVSLGADPDDARAIREAVPEAMRKLRKDPMRTARALAIGFLAPEKHGHE